MTKRMAYIKDLNMLFALNKAGRVSDFDLNTCVQNMLEKVIDETLTRLIKLMGQPKDEVVFLSTIGIMSFPPVMTPFVAVGIVFIELSPDEQVFTFAHELAHIHLHHTTKGNTVGKEIEADELALDWLKDHPRFSRYTYMSEETKRNVKKKKR